MKSTCLFIPPNFPSFKDPVGGNVYYDHFLLASRLFQAVVAVSNISAFGGIHVRSLNANSFIIENKGHSPSRGKLSNAIAIIKHLGVLIWAMKKHNTDIICAHGIRWSGFLGAIVAGLFRKPFFLSL